MTNRYLVRLAYARLGETGTFQLRVFFACYVVNLLRSHDSRSAVSLTLERMKR